ncbi:unnamed protein product [Closterium sp. NIES-53]
MAAQELRWLTYLLTDLGEPPRSPPVLYVDNKAMIALCQEHRLEHRMKHIALRYFLARELQQRGQLCLAYVASRANTADVFTKALQPCDHQPGVSASKPTKSTNVEETALEQSSTLTKADIVDHPVVLLGKLRGVPVKILVDCGASHSFVSSSLVCRLHLEADSAVNFKDARMVDGTPLHIGLVIRKFRVVLGPITVRHDFDSATLDGYDFIFGRDWLRTVSTLFDWAQGSCSVKVDGEFRDLPQWSDGATSTTAIINVVCVRQLVKRAARIFAVFLEEVEAKEGKGGSAEFSEKATLPSEVSALIAKFVDVFPDELPTGLPPSRAVDH